MTGKIDLRLFITIEGYFMANTDKWYFAYSLEDDTVTVVDLPASVPANLSAGALMA